MKKSCWPLACLLTTLALPVFASKPAVTADQPLAPEPRHENIGELITQFVQKSHYLHFAVDDDLSSRVLDNYLDTLDGNRMYLLAGDVEFFEKYRYQLDDMVRDRPLEPVFVMFAIYRTRVR